MSEKNLDLNQPSPLPLVPYGATPYEIDDKNRQEIRQRMMAVAEDLQQHGSIPANVIATVLIENFRRRTKEAHLTNATNFDAESTWKVSHDEALDHYIVHRIKESEGDLTPAERIEQFTEIPTMVAYELFARLRVGERNLLDTTFAVRCLRAITDSRSITSVDERILSSYPKLTRVIPAESSRFGVVTTKLSVGSFDFAGHTIHLKSRQAGVVLVDNLSEHDHRVVSTLTRHQSSAGRTDELMSLRAELHNILAQPDVALPVIESLYLTRLKNDR